MPRPIVSNETVRLVRELPELKLDAGTVGVVRSAWFYPTTAYEVEFPGRGRVRGNRLLLLEGEVAPTADQTPESAQCFAAALAG
jgi:hypothetical protein